MEDDASVLVKEIAALLGAPFEGDGGAEIRSAAALEAAGAGDLAFLVPSKRGGTAEASAAGCLIVPLQWENPAGRTVIRSADPRSAFARALAALYPPETFPSGVHPTAAVDPGATLGQGVSVGPHATVESGAVIGAGTRIGAGCAIGRGARIGPGSLLHPRVTIYSGVTIGARAVLHSGCVLGADGFGFPRTPQGYVKFPQVGRLEIGDDVEIGANSCVDRAALGVTRIGNGVKLDNMVHVGHNCTIGNHVVIAAQTGLAGGCVVEDWAVIGGQVGFGERVRVRAGAIIGSGAGILNDKIIPAGEPYWGTPARPLKEYLRQLANLARLPELRERVRKLEGPGE
jgi:UDP-3-O-[3-hydroxymyristoyl] glucosamine N-acyltransferase